LFLINNNITDPWINLALEEYCLRNLDPTLDIIESKGIPSKKSSVKNISGYLKENLDIHGFRSKIIEGVAAAWGEMGEWKLSDKDWNRIHRMAAEKYQSWDWTFGQSPEFIIRHQFKLNLHKVNTRIRVNRGLVTSIEPEDGEIEGTLISSLIEKPYHLIE